MNVYWYSIQWVFKPRLNKVKAPGGCNRFSEEIYRAELDKIWAQIRQGAFDWQKQRELSDALHLNEAGRYASSGYLTPILQVFIAISTSFGLILSLMTVVPV
ncbi:hypothetical protein [Siminovitchia terrae]|uniref:hypothetical protein n=1 Tax=Siminovitchia terrae TaxID=1914933 RepID=UPI0028A72029|nr:hypothetical protein [Siminovitchia terrae]